MECTVCKDRLELLCARCTCDSSRPCKEVREILMDLSRIRRPDEAITELSRRATLALAPSVTDGEADVRRNRELLRRQQQEIGLAPKATYEDQPPVSELTQAQYGTWFDLSYVDSVRVGPSYGDLLNIIDAVGGIHQPFTEDGGSVQWCKACTTAWPCATINAIKQWGNDQ